MRRERVCVHAFNADRTGAVRPGNRIRFTVDGAVKLELPRGSAISVQHRSFVLERWIALLDLYLCRGPKICLWNLSSGRRPAP
jgi:hypothetical protein